MLTILGQTGGPTQLTANDDTFGIMTQVPDGAVMHSEAGLTAADANTAFGVPFTLMCHFTTGNPEGGSTTLSTTLCDANAPYKFRVLRCRASMLDDANGMLREAANSAVVKITAGEGAIGAGDVSDLRQLDERLIPIARTGDEVVDEDGTLTVECDVRLGETGSTDTLSMLVELTCIRVI
jgi:hypothetical protein